MFPKYLYPVGVYGGKISKVAEAFRRELLPIATVVVSALFSILAFVNGFDAFYSVAVVLCGLPIILEAALALVKERDVTADLLVSVGIVAAILIGEYAAAAEVSIIMRVGEILEDATCGHAESGIEELLRRRPKTARIVEGASARVADVSEVREGTIVRILPGEPVPVDGKVVSGTSSIDTSAMTGESVPVDVSPGDGVRGGTVNLYGSIDIEASGSWEESDYAGMVRLVQQSESETRMSRTVDRWARYIVAIAAVAAASTLLFTQDPERMVTVLVVFCPCALVLATPTAVTAAIGNMARRGILVRDGYAIEGMASVDTVLMDKTGTLTEGRMVCTGYRGLGPGSEDARIYAAALESRSEHPFGRAIAASVEGDLPEVQDFEYRPGKGVMGTVEGHSVAVGGPAFMEELGIGTGDAASGAFVAVDGHLRGAFNLSDVVKAESRATVDSLRSDGVRTVILTGDREGPARAIASETGVDDAVWGCLPADKHRIASNMSSKGAVCMVGDGVNDSAALKAATVGISMGGGDGLVEGSSDIAVVSGSISDIAGILRLSKRTLLTIKLGIAASMAINIAATALGMMGMMSPSVGALVHNGGSIAVIAMAAMLVRYDAWSLGTGRGTSWRIRRPGPSAPRGSRSRRPSRPPGTRSGRRRR